MSKKLHPEYLQQNPRSSGPTTQPENLSIISANLSTVDNENSTVNESSFLLNEVSPYSENASRSVFLKVVTFIKLHSTWMFKIHKFYLLAVALFLTFWYILIPLVVSFYIKWNFPELVDININNFTDSGMYISSKISLPREFPFAANVSVDYMHVYSTTYTNPIYSRYFKYYVGPKVSKVNLSSIYLPKNTVDIDLSVSVDVYNSQIAARCLSGALLGKINNGPSVYFYLGGRISVKFLNVVIHNIDIYSPISFTAQDSAVKIANFSRLSDSETNNELRVAARVDIAQSNVQLRQVTTPPILFGVYYKNQKIIDLNLIGFAQNQNNITGSIYLTALPIQTEDHLRIIESLLENIIHSNDEEIFIKGLSLDEYSSSLARVPNTEFNKYIWLINLISNVQAPIKLKFLTDLISNAKLSIPKPKIKLASGYADIDGKRNSGFTPIISGELDTIFEKPDMKFFEGIVKVAYVSGSFMFYDSELKPNISKTDLLSDIPYEIFSIPKANIPIILDFKPDELTVRSSVKDLYVQINGSSSKKLGNWINNTLATQNVCGYLTGNVDIVINAFGQNIAIKNILISYPVDFKQGNCFLFLCAIINLRFIWYFF
ncbi:hypothetical protein BB561_003027 [Smittium simulii]|uniref:Uncharacterized protein n=1 Tax=Smittium simulii TaxID=133385 RepID=A0A2T9YNF8_9FUNG|nr:hypothetical protein BB561_003027 [Smittium simulii]